MARHSFRNQSGRARGAAIDFRRGGAGVSCHAANVIPIGRGADMVPPGMESEAVHYQCAAAVVLLSFDQIG
ncbi:hypothetical protein SAMN05444123_11031 [Rhodopseudomonas pseudopalustris]|uniref:Uncharacterized protein n=1 Tax=Rhodopseudomonas pseudopalustris TaxID=1513892 RepID=A0A1H8VY02_9BRAD|nr:hypothetical protein SAMN05444123_11031 [Rhodopseudomonas pseudopalustris]